MRKDGQMMTIRIIEVNDVRLRCLVPNGVIDGGEAVLVFTLV